MQSVNFNSVEEFLAYITPEELEVVEYLRELIFDSIPDVSEKLSYNVPYYKRHKNICFLWPGSVLWGKKQAYEGVRRGFINGHLMLDEISYLDQGERKQVAYKDYLRLEDIDADLLRMYLYEAAEIDEQGAM